MATPSTTIDLINEAATHALANAMYSYTFGIAVDGAHGAEGKGLGSGIGVTWKGAYFILTADHVIQHTPYERMYFFPSERISSDRRKLHHQRPNDNSGDEAAGAGETTDHPRRG